MKLKKSFLLFALILNFGTYSRSMAFNGFIGEDNRKESTELTDTLKLRSQSIVTVVRRHENNHVAGGGFKFNVENSNPTDLKICEGQKFSEQTRPSEFVCGGTLISGDLVLTAQNCIQEGSDCTSDYSFIFGYTLGQTEFNPRDVYHCQEVIWQKNHNGTQAALIRLDRPVNARVPVPLNIENTLAEDQSVVLIGPHAKLPLKTSVGNIKYISSEPNHQNAAIGTDLDCHSDDAGSAILNSEGQLIGVLSAATELAAPIPPPVSPTPPNEPLTTLPNTEPDTITENTAAQDKEIEAEAKTSTEPYVPLPSKAEEITQDSNPSIEADKSIIAADSSQTETQKSTTPFEAGSIKVAVPELIPVETSKTCLSWSSPVNVTERSLYQPLSDPKKPNLAYIPRGCTFTPVSAFINEVTQFLPQYQKIIRTPTANTNSNPKN